jgi:hypothetical protein
VVNIFGSVRCAQGAVHQIRARSARYGRYHRKHRMTDERAKRRWQ